MSDPFNSEIDGYIEPSVEELAARRKRNLAIGLCLAGFCVLVFFLMLFKVGTAG